MKITVKRFTLQKRYPLTISRGTAAGSENLMVEVHHAGIVGKGEMAPTSGGEQPETADEAEHNLNVWGDALADCEPTELQRIEQTIRCQTARAAQAAVDCALHDWIGLRYGLPVWKLFGLDRTRIPHTSVTLGIMSPETVRERIPEIMARLKPHIIKVKMGSPEGMGADQWLFVTAQEEVKKAKRLVEWRVDANGGWDVPTARHMIAWLNERGVYLVEQPLPRGQEKDLPRLQEIHPHHWLGPVYVDESVQTVEDIPPLLGNIYGVNLKLMKCGGLREALRIIHFCRTHNLKVMIGCMSESALGITAAAHLGPLVDELDLDSHLNLLNDPFSGAEYRDGRVIPTDWPGLGVHIRYPNLLQEHPADP